MTATIIDCTETYNKILTDLVSEFNPELKIYKSEYVDAIIALEMSIYSNIYVFDDILDIDGELVELAREVNDKIGFIVVSSSGKDICELSDKYNLSEDVILTKPFVFSDFEKALKIASKQ